MTDWFENEALWSELYPYMFPADRLEAGPGEAARIVQLTGFEGGEILDLCCGPGRHAVALARYGRVTGVDRSPFLLEKAREHAVSAGVPVELVLEDMRRFVRPEAFDLVVNMFTSFGYFEDEDEDLRVLENLHRSLRPGGTLLIDVLGKERLAKIFLETATTRHPDGAMLITCHEIFDDWTRIRNEWILVRPGSVQSFAFQHTVYSGRELRDLLRRAGFDDVRLFGDLDGAPYGPNALRLIAVARKRA